MIAVLWLHLIVELKMIVQEMEFACKETFVNVIKDFQVVIVLL